MPVPETKTAPHPPSAPEGDESSFPRCQNPASRLRINELELHNPTRPRQDRRNRRTQAHSPTEFGGFGNSGGFGTGPGASELQHQEPHRHVNLGREDGRRHIRTSEYRRRPHNSFGSRTWQNERQDSVHVDGTVPPSTSALVLGLTRVPRTRLTRVRDTTTYSIGYSSLSLSRTITLFSRTIARHLNCFHFSLIFHC